MTDNKTSSSGLRSDTGGVAAEFLAALNGGLGDFDAWLEVHNERECREVIKPIVQQRDDLLAALKAIVRSAELNQAAINTFLLLEAGAAISRASRLTEQGG